MFLVEIQHAVLSCRYLARVGILLSCDTFWKTKLKYAKMHECRAQISNKNVTVTSANVKVSYC